MSPGESRVVPKMSAFIRKHAVLFVLSGLYVANFADRSVLAVVVEPMKADLGLSDGEIGLVQSMLLFCLPILLIPSSLILDLWSRKKMIFLVAIVWSLGCLGTGLATGFLILLLARVICAFGEATFGPGGTAWVSMSYPAERRSSMLGFFSLAAPLGMALGTLGGGFMVTATGNWRSPFFCLIALGVGLALCVLALTDYRTDGDGKRPDLGLYLAETLGLFRNRTLMLVSVATASFCFIKFSYQGWVPAMLVRSYGLSSMHAGVLFTLMVLAGVLGPIVGGQIADRAQRGSPIGRPRIESVLVGLVVVSKAIFYGLMGVVSLPVIVVLGVVDSIVTMAPIPVYFSLAQDVVSVRLKSMSVGLFGVIVFLGGAWGPVAVGALSDLFGGGAAGLRLAMLSNVLAGILSAGLFLLSCRTYANDKVRAGRDAPTPSSSFGSASLVGKGLPGCASATDDRCGL